MESEYVSLAFCSFCSAPDDAVNVICEGRCLICYRCQRSHGIRQMLTRCIENSQHDISACPLCAQPMAPNMISTIKKYRKDATVAETSESADFSQLQLNPFLPYLRRNKQVNDTTAPTTATSSPKLSRLASTTEPSRRSLGASRSAKRIQFAIDFDASQDNLSTSTQQLSVDITAANKPVSKTAPSPKNHSKSSGVRVVTVPPLSMQISESFVMDCVCEMYSHIYESATKDILELPFPLLWKHLSKNRFNKNVVAQKLHLFLSYVTDALSPLLSSSATPTNLAQAPSSSPSAENVNKVTRSSSTPVLSRRHSKSQAVGGSVVTNKQLSLTSQYNASHIYIFASAVLGLYPTPAEVVRPNSAYLTTFLYIAVLFAERCVRQGAVFDIKAGIPSPTCQEVSGKLRAYLCDGVTTTTHLSTRKCVSIIRLLLCSNDSQWSISQLHGACVEFGASLPWTSSSSKFFGAFVAFVKEYCSVAAHNSGVDEGARKYRHSSVTTPATANVTSTCHFHIIENLSRLVEDTWHAGGNISITIGSVYDFLPSNATIPPALFILFCLSCWNAEYNDVARNIRLSQISISRRQATYPTMDPHTFEPLTLAEQIALKHIYDMFVQYEKCDAKNSETIPRNDSSERGFIDWEAVREKVAARDVPFSVPKSLLSRSVMELEYRIMPLQKQHLQREIQKCVERSGWQEEWCWMGVAVGCEQIIVTPPTRHPPKQTHEQKQELHTRAELAVRLTEQAPDIFKDSAVNPEMILCGDNETEEQFEPTNLATYFDGMDLKPMSSDSLVSSLDIARTAGRSAYSKRRHRPQSTPDMNRSSFMSSRGRPSPMTPNAAPSSLSCISLLNSDVWSTVKPAKHRPNLVDIVHGVVTTDVLEKVEMLPSYHATNSSILSVSPPSRPHTSAGEANRKVLDLAHYNGAKQNELPTLPIDSKIAEIYLQDALRNAPQGLHSLLTACITNNTSHLRIIDLSNNKRSWNIQAVRLTKALSHRGVEVLSMKIGASYTFSVHTFHRIHLMRLDRLQASPDAVAALSVLSLSDNEIKLAASGFVNLTKPMPNLRTLDLSSNQISVDDRLQYTSITALLSSIPSLEELLMSYNRLHNKGVIHILRQLKQSSLRVVAMKHCFLSSPIINDILSFAQDHGNTVLLLEGAIFTKQEVEHIKNSSGRILLSALPE